ncbi:hypothetical protein [Planomonospora venezuelensis]|uniref:Putative Zn finger protein n=1 Tax=Planomonospora venezuelensis TaxID=1999 RepID=A0A841CYR4_PLAVE|nr:hypothetical protein [Planomonospora venezuelensis]MBB5961248.1 putative Zn finger protein [Planomonospora venezuelensis]GIM99923.1 hypothetical protein Pve01_15820 [Planomonospora venezuelensis]
MMRVAELVESELARAAEAVLTRGGELERAGRVQLVRFGPRLMTAEVDDGAACVEFRIADGSLEWYCTCAEGRRGVFCAHCAATAQSVRRRTDKNASCGVPSVTASESTVRIAS